MKFRYGIFEEYGFVQDSMYPNFFYSKGNMLPTGTSNIQLGKEVYKTFMRKKEMQSAIRAIFFTDRNITSPVFKQMILHFFCTNNRKLLEIFLLQKQKKF